ncbi:MAG: nucleotidyltransferase family protein [Bacteroidota bacterium]
MKTLTEIKKQLVNYKSILRKKYNVKEIGVFGSYSRGEQDRNSDIDILVVFDKPIGLEFIDLAEELEIILKNKVDLVSKNAIKPKLMKYVEEDLIYV